MAESIAEQVAYGSWCKHGTPLGTPGGADLMCGLCESGYDYWIEDPGYTLWFRFTDQPLTDETGVPWTRIGDWRHSQIPDFVDWATVPGPDRKRNLGFMTQMFNDSEVSRETRAKCQWKVSRTSEGYWDDTPGALPAELGTPAPSQVKEDNPHGTHWKLIESGDQGPTADEYDRYFVRYESSEGYWADYFNVNGTWHLGAN